MITWHAHLDVILWLVGLQVAYLVGIRWVGARVGQVVTTRQVVWFSAGVLVLYAGAGTPIHDLAEERLLTVHMFQHMLFTLVAPPMLILGMPDWLLAALFGRPPLLGAFRFLVKPLVAFSLFNVTVLFTHLPPAVDLALNYHAIHFVFHVVLTLTAALMWWPVFGMWAAAPRLAPLVQVVYLFVQSLVPTVLASFLTFAHTAIYAFYVNAPRTWGWSAVDDQLIAGLMMKLLGGFLIWGVIGVRFFQWASQQNRAGLGGAPPPLQWNEVEAELGRMGLTKTGAGTSAT